MSGEINARRSTADSQRGQRIILRIINHVVTAGRTRDTHDAQNTQPAVSFVGSEPPRCIIVHSSANVLSVVCVTRRDETTTRYVRSPVLARVKTFNTLSTVFHVFIHPAVRTRQGLTQHHCTHTCIRHSERATLLLELESRGKTSVGLLEEVGGGRHR